MRAMEAIRGDRVVAVLRRVADTRRVVSALREGGIRIVEITLDSDRALDTIAALRSDPDLVVLAGTVRTVGDVDSAAAAGAEGCVSPVLVPDVVERCRSAGLAAIPGAFTPSEIEAAWGLGAAMVKLFPASLGGPAYVRDVLAPLSDVPLLATGGVDAGNARAFLRAGVCAVGVGTALVGAADPAAAARELLGSVRDA
jgi:2-dehydro-3-deoxyphosphogluconate aldolase / (4S)-4-hydroxy-2-oxoglutarate aldolase